MAKTSAQKDLEKHWAKQAREAQKKMKQQQPQPAAEKHTESAPASAADNKKKRK